MNSKIFLIIIVLIVAFGAFTLLGNKKTSSVTTSTQPTSEPTLTETNNQIANVILGDSGFVPKDITVKAGTMVVWINKSGEVATISSDDHPTHRLYPLLNLGEFASSSTLQVVFDKAGTYPYHNHYNSNDTGTVTVE